MDTGQLAAIAGPHRVHRSFGFIDLSGFTDYCAAQGDQAAVTELHHLRAAVRDVTPRFGVRVEKWLGDGAMLVAVDTEPLVAAVVAIHERHRGHGALPLRAGIAVGDVLLLDGDDYTGQAVNLAARLCDYAAPDELLASIDQLVLPDWVQQGEQRHVIIRGLPNPVSVVPLRLDASKLSPRPGGLFPALLDGLTRPVRIARAARPD